MVRLVIVPFWRGSEDLCSSGDRLGKHFGVVKLQPTSKEQSNAFGNCSATTALGLH